MNGGEHREGEEPGSPKKARRLRILGVALLAVAALSWVAAPAAAFFPLSTAQKVWAGSAFLVLGEVAFWLAAFALGREILRRYRRYLDPRSLFGKARR